MAHVITGKADIANLIPTVWSPKLYARLKETMVFGNIFSREYEGEIASLGQTVNVNQIGPITASDLADDESVFESAALVNSNFTVTANKLAVASVEITDMAKLQSIDFQNDLIDELTFALLYKLETNIIAALIPSASAPDHDIAPAVASDLAAVDLGAVRTLASRAKWPLMNRYFVASPEYYSDLANKTQIMSTDFSQANNSDAGAVQKFMGFGIGESNVLGTDTAFACHPSALQLVMQKGITIKVSDQHVNRKLGYLVSAHMIYGYQLFDNKRIIKISG
jgi:hypothetical protein